MANPPSQGHDPGPEPEIIPPDRPGGPRRDGAPRIWLSFDDGTQQRIRVVRPGPFTTVLLALLVALVGIVLAVIFLGTVLIIVPAIIVIVAFLIAVGMLRRRFGRGRLR